MTGIFKANAPSNAFVLFLYGLVLRLPAFLHPVAPQPQQTDGFLYKALLQLLQPFGNVAPLIYPVITTLLLFTQAITFNKLASGQRLLPKSNYLTGMAYLLITALFPDWGILSSALIINTLLLWVWARLSNLHTQQNTRNTLFNIGMAIGICTFFYFPSIAFTLLIGAGLVTSRSFRPAEWLIALMGIITPYYFLLAFAFLTGRLKGYQFPGFSVSAPHFANNRWEYVSIGILLFLGLTGVFFEQRNIRRQLIQTRKSWNLIFLYLLVALFIPFINATHSFQYWILSAIPLSAIAACTFFYPVRKKIPWILHWLLVAYIAAMYFIGNKG